jgi:hypothetical protein
VDDLNFRINGVTKDQTKGAVVKTLASVAGMALKCCTIPWPCIP